jgi:putative membrane protein
MNIKHWVVSAIAIGICAYIIPGVSVTILGAFILAVVLGALNMFIRPIVSILTLPLTVITLGLFSLVINAGFILLCAKIVPGFIVANFFSAFLFGIALSLVHSVLSFGGKK